VQPAFQTALGPDLDPRALCEIRARHAALERELTEARGTNDLGRQAALVDELEQLEDAALHRCAAQGDDHERARTAVTKAIAKAIREIGMHHPGLGHHLKTHVVTGKLCRYEPDPEHPIRWQA
jgi:hypothetical protein